MAVPSFNGVEIFGVGFTSRARANPARLQWNCYNGVDGRERLNHGSTGVQVEFPAFLQLASDEATLAGYENLFLNLQANATLGVLVDTLGRTWPRATLVAWEPTEQVEPHEGGVSRTYRCVFEVG